MSCANGQTGGKTEKIRPIELELELESQQETNQIKVASFRRATAELALDHADRSQFG